MLDKIKTEPALVAGAVQAVLGLLLAFGVPLNHTQVGAILAVVAAILAFIVRQAVTPVASLEEPPVPVVDDASVKAVSVPVPPATVTQAPADPPAAPPTAANDEGGYAYANWVVVALVVMVLLILLIVSGIISVHH